MVYIDISFLYNNLKTRRHRYIDMVNYQNGKIYMIMTENSNDIYIGSTTQTIKRRLEEHESRFRQGIQYCSSQEILKQGNYKIVLIKNFACNSLLELETEETKFQKDLVCVNKVRARITDEEKKQYIKQYRIDNKETIKQQRKQYRIDNKESIKQNSIDNRERAKQYRIDNKEKLKQYKINNKEKIKQQRKQYRQRKKQERENLKKEAEKQKRRIIFKIKK